ncbi:MAG: hypothetical protein V4478_03090 [Patescibacteria group bacterium]
MENGNIELFKNENDEEIGRVVPLNPEIESIERFDSEEMSTLEQMQAEYDALQAQIAKLQEESSAIAEKIKRELDDQAA